MKKVYVSMTVKVPGGARYKATDSDGCTFFYMAPGTHHVNPYWIDIHDYTSWFAYYGCECGKWKSSIEEIDKELWGKNTRYNFYINVPEDDKWLVMTSWGHVYSSKEEPWVTRSMDSEEEQECWCIKGHFTHVTETNINCEKWKESKVYIP